MKYNNLANVNFYKSMNGIISKTLEENNFVVLDAEQYFDESGKEYALVVFTYKQKPERFQRAPRYEILFDDFNAYTRAKSIKYDVIKKINSDYARHMALLNIQNQQKYIQDYIKQQVITARDYLNNLLLKNRKTKLKQIKEKSAKIFEDCLIPNVYKDMILYNYFLNPHFGRDSAAQTKEDYAKYCLNNIDDIAQIIDEALMEYKHKLNPDAKINSQKDKIKRELQENANFVLSKHLGDTLSACDASKFNTPQVSRIVDGCVKINELEGLIDELKEYALAPNKHVDASDLVYKFYEKSCQFLSLYEKLPSGECDFNNENRDNANLGFNDYANELRAMLEPIEAGEKDEEAVRELPLEAQIAYNLEHRKGASRSKIINNFMPQLEAKINSFREITAAEKRGLPADSRKYVDIKTLVDSQISKPHLSNNYKELRAEIEEKYSDFDLEIYSKIAIDAYPDYCISRYFEAAQDLEMNR